MWQVLHNILVLAVWGIQLLIVSWLVSYVLQRWVLPRFGVST